MNLSNTIAVVTGGGRGIGRAVALTFAREGATVIAAARSQDEIAETVWLIEELGQHAYALTVDVRDSESIDAFATQVIERVGTPHVLVNSAGIGLRAPLVETTPELWDNVHATLLRGTYLVTRAFLPAMIAQGGGNIINIGAPIDKLALPGFAAYSAAKHGVEGLTKALAKELRRHKINVNALHPGGFADTRLMRETAPEVNKGLLAPESVSAAAVFLARQEKRGTTGVIIDSQTWQPDA